jgi:fused signal recognition particle receptor
MNNEQDKRYITTSTFGRRHRPRLTAILAAALAAASSTLLSSPDAPIIAATAFAPPPSSRPPHDGRAVGVATPKAIGGEIGGRHSSSKFRSRHRDDTSLGMVFDFFKKASTDASEQMSAFATGLAKSRNQLLYGLEDSLASLYDGRGAGAGGGGGNLLDRLEDTLLQADIGLATAEDVLSEARFLREESTEIFGRDDVKALLRGKLLEALGASAGGGSSEYSRVRARAGSAGAPSSGDRSGGVEGYEDRDGVDGRGSFALRFAGDGDARPISAKRPLTVHFVMGANGMGKTTTIGKLAYRLRNEAGKKVLLAACDTFRAGAVAQLEQWAVRSGVDCHSPSENTNGPSAVLYGALDRAIDGGYDVLLVDTSGRLSNNDALTAELVKMKRVIQKRMSTRFDENIKPVPNVDVPHETLLVIDAAQGRIALDSAKQWDKELGLTGLILTKLDGSAKGGSVVAVSRELGLPVKLVGIGEGMEDLRDVSNVLFECRERWVGWLGMPFFSISIQTKPHVIATVIDSLPDVSTIQFDPESFVDGLLGIGIAGGGASKSEGTALASRLNQMRKERNERAKVIVKKEQASSPLKIEPGGGIPMPGNLDGIVSESLDMNEVELAVPGGGGVARGKSKNKKKKKGKR